MKNKSIFFALFASTLFSLTSSIFACENGQREERQISNSHHHFFLDLADSLKLTDAQIVKLNKLRIESQNKWNAATQKTKLAKEALVKMSHESEVDPKTSTKIIDEVSLAEKELMKIEIQSLLDAKSLLTKEQRKLMWENAHKEMPKACCHGEK